MHGWSDQPNSKCIIIEHKPVSSYIDQSKVSDKIIDKTVQEIVFIL